MEHRLDASSANPPTPSACRHSMALLLLSTLSSPSSSSSSSLLLAVAATSSCSLTESMAIVRVDREAPSSDDDASWRTWLRKKLICYCYRYCYLFNFFANEATHSLFFMHAFLLLGLILCGCSLGSARQRLIYAGIGYYLHPYHVSDRHGQK